MLIKLFDPNLRKNLRKRVLLPAVAVLAFSSAQAGLFTGDVFAQSASRLASQAEQIMPLDSIVANVNGEDIYFAEVIQVFANLGPQFQQLGLTNVYNQVVERLVEQRMMVQSAKADGLDQTPQAQAEFKFLQNSVLEQRYLDAAFASIITEDRLRAAYDTFEAPSETRASHILVEDEQEAIALIAQLREGADFAALAAESSIGPSGPNGGDLGFFTAEQMVPPFSVAAFALAPGEITQQPVQTRFGWHVIEVTDRRDAEKPPFEQLREGLALQLQEQALNDIIVELRGASTVEIVPLKQ